MNDLRSPLESGLTLRNGDFTIESPLGMGGFGITYRAYDHRLKRSVAVKEFFPQGGIRHDGQLKPSSGWTEEELKTQRERFLQEARILAQLRHPGIPMIFDIFEENETAYLVMEFVDGLTLAQYMAEKNLWFLPPDEALTLIKGAGEALNVMHEAQLLHRDLKPSNIMRRSDGQVMLIDFGASRGFLPETVHTLTVIFTAGYAPLEQYNRSGNHGPYTDVYSLAATLYYLLTGQKPLEALWRATGEVLPSPSQVNSAISDALSNAVMHGLEIPPGQRPPTIDAFLRELTASQAGDVVGTFDVTGDTTSGSSPPSYNPTLQAATNDSTTAPPLSSPSKVYYSQGRVTGRDSPDVPSFIMPSASPNPASPSSFRSEEMERGWSVLPTTIVSRLKIIGWTGLGWAVGFALGAFVSSRISLPHSSWRRAEAVWYMQLNLSLLFAMWLGRWSYIKEKQLHRERAGKTQNLDSSKFSDIIRSSLWNIVVGWLWLTVLGKEYLYVTRGKHGYPNIKEALIALLIIWPLLCVYFSIYRLYQKNKPLNH